MAVWGHLGVVFSRMCNRISMRPTTIMVDICRSKPQKWPLDHDFAWVGTFFQAVMTTRFAEYVNVSNEKRAPGCLGLI